MFLLLKCQYMLCLSGVELLKELLKRWTNQFVCYLLLDNFVLSHFSSLLSLQCKSLDFVIFLLCSQYGQRVLGHLHVCLHVVIYTFLTGNPYVRCLLSVVENVQCHRES